MAAASEQLRGLLGGADRARAAVCRAVEENLPTRLVQLLALATLASTVCWTASCLLCALSCAAVCVFSALIAGSATLAGTLAVSAALSGAAAVALACGTLWGYVAVVVASHVWLLGARTHRWLSEALGSMRNHGKDPEAAALPSHGDAPACTAAGTTASCQPLGTAAAAAAAAAETAAGGESPGVGGACAADDAGTAGLPAHAASVAGCSAKNTGVVDSPVDAAKLHELMHALAQLARCGAARGEFSWLAGLEDSLAAADAGAAPGEETPHGGSVEERNAETSPATERSIQRQAQHGHADDVALLLLRGVAALKAGDVQRPGSGGVPADAGDVLAACDLASGLEADGVAVRAGSPWSSESAAADAAGDPWSPTAPVRHRRAFQAVS